MKFLLPLRKHRVPLLIIELMRRMQEQYSTTFVFSTHDQLMSHAADTFTIRDGLLLDHVTEAAS